MKTLPIAAFLLGLIATTVTAAPTQTAIFAGGCFWCMQEAFDKVPGVVSTTVGYTGGHVANPTYRQVSAGGTGHAESIRVTYDPDKTSYEKLLDAFWHNIDPTVKDRQFCDRGHQYRSAIFYENAEQERLAEASEKKIEGSGRFKGPLYTEIVPASTFYPAEDYHQEYYRKNPVRYTYYHWACGRAARLKQLWGKDAGDQ